MININTHYANDISLFILWRVVYEENFITCNWWDNCICGGNEGLVPGLSAEELLNYFSKSSRNLEIDCKILMNIDSTNMQPEHWKEIANAVFNHYDDYDGFVITHGTDTLAYTSSALSYMLQGLRKPVVLTGSQVPISFKRQMQRKM